MCVLKGLGIALALSVGGFAAAAEYRIAPTPEWVSTVAPGPATPELVEQSSDGVFYALVDTQVLLGKSDRTFYRRFASKALSVRGVESIANIEVSFDPDYQTLFLHSINVLRDGQSIAKLADAEVKLLQRETELDAQIYDGSKTASVFLKDVRVGDTVEYSYSLRGRNPVFGARDFGSFALHYGIPVGRIHARLLAPTERPILLAPRNTKIQPERSETSNLVTYTWDLTAIKAAPVDNDAPGWFDPYELVEWGEFRDWREVSQWALPLYAPLPLTEPLKREVQRIAAAESTPEARLLAVLKLVQQEVRYLAISIGRGSHAPNDPNLVWERRFGDCKDKTLLMLSMLQALGIGAHAALVDTERGRALLHRSPSPGQFDHVLVAATINGKHHWLDPTRAPQSGDLTHVYQPDFGVALVVAPNTQALSTMDTIAPRVNARKVEVTINAGDGFTQPIEYTVKTTHRGRSADITRSDLANTGLDELQKKYLNFYRSDFPQISRIQPLAVKDDAARNSIVTTERYRITDHAVLDKDSKRFEANIPAPDIAEFLHQPDTLVRNSPLAQTFPLDVTVITTVALPDLNWDIDAESHRVKDASFQFEREVTHKNRTLRIEDHFKTTTDAVSAAKLPQYVANLDRARTATSYGLSWPSEAAPAPDPVDVWMEQINWPLAFGLPILLALLIGLALLVHSRFAKQHKPSEPPPLKALDPSAPAPIPWTAR
jgi:Domain of Unknown Function with PDB structure (DUF3857)/Transglutaminase-like superfamily